MLFGKSKKIDCKFADMHCHIMPEVDDGSPDMETTKEMLHIAYEDGIRTICLTPHIRRPWLHREKYVIPTEFEQVRCAAKEIADDLEIYLGCELMYSEHVLQKYKDQLIGMNHTNYLLVEFDPNDDFNVIRDGLNHLISMGWDPILAHMERYFCIADNVDYVRRLKEMGIYLQVNANSIVNKHGKLHRSFMQPVLDERLVHFVSTDAHDTGRRRPELNEAAAYVEKYCGHEYMNKIFSENAISMLRGESL